MNQDPTRTSAETRALHPVARFPADWEVWLSERGERTFRAGQVFRWLHQRGVFEPSEMTDLSKALRATLAEAGLAPPMEVAEVQRSSDGTRKLLMRLHDGRAVECVLIPMSNDDDADVACVEADEELDLEESKGARLDAPRRPVTLCVSTQVGCAMACRFCASGQAGLTRGLSAAEVVSQVLLCRRYLDADEQLKNLVFMGMGEPLHHYDETVRALRLLTHPDGLGMSPRRITVSTVGLVPNIRRLGEDFDGKIGLAVSLHAPDNETRDKIMPINSRFDVDSLLDALRRYPLPKRRRITIEYTLIDGVNDSVEHARRLAQRLSGIRTKVNLIPMNPIDGSPLRAPEAGVVEAFRAVLAEHRVSCSVRKRRGDDVDAACGQLALKNQAPAADDAVVGRRRLGLAPEEPGGGHVREGSDREQR
jgi:23S rRNA (adenine2503-C2)-methyltransferase